ncbi:TWiK family of potassium channels protein 7-like protein, partial [Dinothrombium tinctorium]
MAIDRRKTTRKSRRQRNARNFQESFSMREVNATAKCKKYCKKFVAFLFSHVGLCALVVGYMVCGAFLFQKLENEPQHERIDKLREAVNALKKQKLENMWNATDYYNTLFKHNWTAVVKSELKTFQKSLIEQISEGYNPKYKDKWTFSGSFLFSLTVITSIVRIQNNLFAAKCLDSNDSESKLCHRLRAVYLQNAFRDAHNTNVLNVIVDNSKIVIYNLIELNDFNYDNASLK